MRDHGDLFTTKRETLALSLLPCFAPAKVA